MRKDAIGAKLINLDTGEEIRRVVWANDETGRYRQYLTDENGSLVVNKARNAIESKVFTGNIKIITRNENDRQS